MFEIIYAKSTAKDIKHISPKNFSKIKQGIEELKNFPNTSQIKHLSNHPIAEFRLRIGNYRVLFDVEWESRQIIF